MTCSIPADKRFTFTTDWGSTATVHADDAELASIMILEDTPKIDILAAFRQSGYSIPCCLQVFWAGITVLNRRLDHNNSFSVRAINTKFEHNGYVKAGTILQAITGQRAGYYLVKLNEQWQYVNADHYSVVHYSRQNA